MLKKIVKNTACLLLGCRPLLRTLEKCSGGKVVILMYHRVTEEPDLMGLAISSSFFEKQLKYLVKNYIPISLGEAIARFESGELYENYIVLTFDDGFRDNYTNAYPLLKKYGVPATVFIACNAVENGFSDWNLMDDAIWSESRRALNLSEFGLGSIPTGTAVEKQAAIFNLRHQLKQVGHPLRKKVIRSIAGSGGVTPKRIMLTWEEVGKLTADGLVTVGAHTVSHPILSKISPEDARSEIVGSIRIIQEKTGLDVDFFAYPNGTANDFDNETVAIVKATGFRAACSTISGVNRLGADKFRLKRIDVTYGICKDVWGGFSKQIFGAYISGEYSFLSGRV